MPGCGAARQGGDLSGSPGGVCTGAVPGQRRAARYDKPERETGVIRSKVRDKRFTTIHRGGPLMDADHHLLAAWTADCAAHVRRYVEKTRPHGSRAHPQIQRPGSGKILWACHSRVLEQGRSFMIRKLKLLHYYSNDIYKTICRKLGLDESDSKSKIIMFYIPMSLFFAYPLSI
jgi:hypothetical protein